MASKILIVEDEPDIVELLAYHLNQAGFETEAVTNGRDALNQMSANPPDLILFGFTASRSRWTRNLSIVKTGRINRRCSSYNIDSKSGRNRPDSWVRIGS